MASIKHPTLYQLAQIAATLGSRSPNPKLEDCARNARALWNACAKVLHPEKGEQGSLSISSKEIFVTKKDAKEAFEILNDDEINLNKRYRYKEPARFFTSLFEFQKEKGLIKYSEVHQENRSFTKKPKRVLQWDDSPPISIPEKLSTSREQLKEYVKWRQDKDSLKKKTQRARAS